MKTKFAIFLCVLALSLSLIPRSKVFAVDKFAIGQALILSFNSAYPDMAPGLYTIYCDTDSARFPYDYYTRCYVKINSDGIQGWQCFIYDSFNQQYKELLLGSGANRAPKIYFDDAQYQNNFTINTSWGDTVVYSTEQSFYDNVPDEYLPEDPTELTWYEELFNDFIDYIGAGINNGIDGFLNWLREAWITPVGEGEDELALDLITPTPTPTPLPTPTPIPYETQLVPDGNGGFNIQYVYINPSGVPTSAPQPPTNQPQPTGSGFIDDDFDYPYYDNPNNKDDPYTLDIPWYLKFSFGGAATSLDDFQEGMDAIVDNVNDQDENISVVMDSMGLFPNDWLLMIGFIGAIPLVGGLISRLLKG